MLFTNFDQIVRRNLLDKGRSIHYYFEELLHATACVRELTFDTLRIVNYLELPVDPTDMSVTLPDDFVDDVAVTIPVGGFLQPIVKNDSITEIRTISPTGAYENPTTGFNPNGSETFYGFNTNWFWFWNITDYGEPTGRYFGAHGGPKLNGYKVIKSQRRIQMTQIFTSPTIVLIYISDGQRADNASLIDVEAFATIQAWIEWKKGPNAQNNNSPEGQYYYNERRKLNTRLDGTTADDIRGIILSAYNAAMKN